jgi:ABC-2 type transport system permease protein
MRTLNFARRNVKELVRDPLSTIFSLALPLFLLFIFNQIKIPSPAYALDNFTPGIIIFSFSFVSMFTAILIAKDRSTSFLTRLAVSPMKPHEYVLGYVLSLLPLVCIQIAAVLILALILGLKLTWGVLVALPVGVVISFFFIALGITFGSITNEKASAGVSSIVVQLVSFTSGMYFPRELVGEGFAVVCEFLPFESALTILKAALSLDFAILEPRNVIVFCAYTVAFFVLAVVLFNKNNGKGK